MFSAMRTIVAGKCRSLTSFGMTVLMAATAAAQDLTGVVYSDRNANGTRDPREPGIANVAVSDQDTVVMTMADGSFSLRKGRGNGLVFVSQPTGYRVMGTFWRRTDERNPGRVQGSETAGDGEQTVSALVPTSEIIRYAIDLRSLTGGRGRFQATHDHYDVLPSHLVDKVKRETKDAD